MRDVGSDGGILATSDVNRRNEERKTTKRTVNAVKFYWPIDSWSWNTEYFISSRFEMNGRDSWRWPPKTIRMKQPFPRSQCVATAQQPGSV